MNTQLNVFTKTDCASNSLCIYVKAIPGIVFDESVDDIFVKDYKLPGSGKYTVDNAGYIYHHDNSGNFIGWEACFVDVPTGELRPVEIHTNYNKGETASTGKLGTPISLDLTCGGVRDDQAIFFFSVPCNPSDMEFCEKETLCPEDDADALDDAEDRFQLTTNVITCDARHEETFDSAGDAESWENGVETRGEGIGNFLGRFGLENPMVMKTFIMPTTATKANV
jgi:hypothetical protein